MNMFPHGMDNFRIEWGDTLRNPWLIEGHRPMKFDIVVAGFPENNRQIKIRYCVSCVYIEH